MSKEQYLVVATAGRDYVRDTFDGYSDEYEETVEKIYGWTVEEVLKASANFAEEHEYYSNEDDKCKVSFSPVFKIEEICQVDGVNFFEVRKVEAEKRKQDRIEAQRIQAAKREEEARRRELAELARLQAKYKK